MFVLKLPLFEVGLLSLQVVELQHEVPVLFHLVIEVHVHFEVELVAPFLLIEMAFDSEVHDHQAAGVDHLALAVLQRILLVFEVGVASLENGGYRVDK